MVYAVVFAKTVVSIVRHLERLRHDQSWSETTKYVAAGIGDSLSQMAPSHGEG
jgi:hypothetical protein